VAHFGSHLLPVPCTNSGLGSTQTSRGTMAMADNIILLSDSYKVSHWRQYPPGTEYVYSYFESRGCDRKGWDDVCFFGLQYFLKRYLVGEVVTRAKIEEAAQMYQHHFGDGVNPNPDMFYREGWEYILERHGGRLPIKIKAVPEGMVIPTKTVLITVVNTDPKCFWLTNFLETLLVQVWYPMTVCTNSRNQKKSIQKYLEETGCQDWSIPNGASFKLHDFGFRGVSSVESAAIGGLGHLVNFLGSDTVASLVCAQRYYNCGQACGFSIPASEHSTITSWGVDGEVDAMRNMLEQYPSGLVACVSDSFDIWKACRDYWGGELKDMIKARPGQLVVRPDSGDPADTCVKIMKILCERFKEDVSLSPTGHKVLPPYIRLIQGDGVDYESIPKILKRFKDEGFAAQNITFGSGGALLQKVNRDTFKVAFKCSAIVVDGQDREVFKDPITDDGKASKKGVLTLQLASDFPNYSREDVYKPRQGAHGVKGGTGFLHFTPDGQYVTVASGQGDESRDLLVDVFENGTLLKDYTLDEIRRLADIHNGPFTQDLMQKADSGATPLKVTIISARGLRDADWMPGSGTSDPYCICEIPDKPNAKFQTPVVDNNEAPVWNYEEIMEEYAVGDNLVFTVYDQDTVGKGDCLGTVTLASEHFFPDGFEGDVPLNDAGKGVEAFLTVRVEPQAPALPAADAAAAEAAFNAIDSNHDGVITRQEFTTTTVGGVPLPPPTVIKPSATISASTGAYVAAPTSTYTVGLQQQPVTTIGALSGSVVAGTVNAGMAAAGTPGTAIAGAPRYVAAGPTTFRHTNAPVTTAYKMAPASPVPSSGGISYVTVPPTAGLVSPQSCAPSQASSRRPSYVAAPQATAYKAASPTTASGRPSLTAASSGSAAIGGSRTVFDAIDRNHDGVITRAEFAAALAAQGQTMAASPTVIQRADAVTRTAPTFTAARGAGAPVMVAPQRSTSSGVSFTLSGSQRS